MKKYILLFVLIVISGCFRKKADRFVSLNETKFHIKEYGKGQPTVIFENGMGSGMDTWKSIPDSIAKATSIFSYDRAGIGKSDIASQDRTIPNMVKELREVLAKENIGPPYIFVAHSMGSYVGRYYAIHFPDEISALLLIDPSPDRLYDGYTEQEYKEFKEFGDQSFANSKPGERLEWENYLENRQFINKKKIPDHIPLVIVSATQWDFYEYHSQIMNNNTYSKHLKETGSHDIHQDKPELIIKLIHELIESTK